MKKILLLIFLFLSLNCSNREKKIKDIVEYWNGREIIFTNNLMLKIIGKDTVIPNHLNSQYKILRYLDTNKCTECRLKLFDWKIFQKQIDSLKIDINFIFVIWSNRYEELEKLQQLNDFYIPIYYDTIGEMKKINKISQEDEFQTFLLDSNNHVLGIGDPVNNKAIWKLYKKILLRK